MWQYYTYERAFYRDWAVNNHRLGPQFYIENPSLESVADEKGCIKEQSGNTEIFIYPGYRFKCVDALITNFHLPESTLLMLISAFMGKEQALGLYRLAVQERYRFFSFGDAMLIV